MFPQTKTPLNIPGCVFQLNSTNPFNTNTQPANNSLMSSAVDISGSRISVIQATSSNQPTFETNVSGDQPAIVFNSDAGGVNGDSLKTSVAGFLNTLNLANGSTGFTIFVCARIAALTPPATQSGCMLFMQGSSPSSNEVYQITQSTSGAINCSITNSAGTQSSMTAGNATINTPFITSFWWDKSAATIYSQFNSASIVTGPNAGTISALNTAPTLFAIGQQKNSSPNRHFDGKIFEILIYKRLLTTDQRLEVRQSLTRRFGLPL
jgi:hypothetical protein